MHGGDIYRNKIYLDFSVNINPLGMPGSVEKALLDCVGDCLCYPDLYQEELKRGIGEMTGVREGDIVCGNGASELFPAIVRAFISGRGQPPSRKKVLLPVPSFSGYDRAVRFGGGETVYWFLKKENGFCLDEGIREALSEEIGLLILANPNNPTGHPVEPALLEDILQTCREKDIRVVLDECFIDFLEDGEARSFLHKTAMFRNLTVVRSFTKIFAIPGVRLGYLVSGDPLFRESIRGQLPEWNVSVPAQRAGVSASREIEYVRKSRAFVAKEREYLRQKLSELGFCVCPGAANYLLFQTSFPLGEKLLERGILIRDCSDYKGLERGYYRIAVKGREENEKLLRELRKLCGVSG